MDNCVYMFDDFSNVNAMLGEDKQCRVILCRISKSAAAERALVAALAVSKCQERVLINNNELIFQLSSDLDEFENEVRIIFS
ncbi:unknown protein [Spodoptera frugiperda multiple nucleopolyhedrovirus]|nr:hypothetical protein SFMNPV_gp027 [Spodoptera frugiperda multiple nucleopolyhedrovirus]ABM45738.1 unknown protein [Spodoptera frugiperda multiple nucleopolyhedrovirus]